MAELDFNLLTVRGYAGTVHKSERTVRRWIQEGRLRARKDKGGRNWLIMVRNVTDFTSKFDVPQ